MQKRDKNYIESVTCYGKVIMHFVSIIKGKILCVICGLRVISSFY